MGKHKIYQLRNIYSSEDQILELSVKKHQHYIALKKHAIWYEYV